MATHSADEALLTIVATLDASWRNAWRSYPGKAVVAWPAARRVPVAFEVAKSMQAPRPSCASLAPFQPELSAPSVRTVVVLNDDVRVTPAAMDAVERAVGSSYNAARNASAAGVTASPPTGRR